MSGPLTYYVLCSVICGLMRVGLGYRVDLNIMKKFEEGLKEKAHQSKIRQAKTTILSSIKPQSKLANSKVAAEAQLLLELYEKKSYDSIPAYKLLRTAGLQQYTRGFIQRGYGINLGKLALISDDDKRKLYD